VSLFEANKVHHCVMTCLIKIRPFRNSKESSLSELRVSFVVLGKIITNESYIHEEIKSRLNSGNTFYSSVQNLISFCLLSSHCVIK
jgi:hypothetical protein